MVVTGGMVVGGRGGPKGLLVQLEGLQTLTVIKEVVSSLVDAQSCYLHPYNLFGTLTQQPKF